MTDPHLPAEYAGHAIRWEPWQERAVCGRIPVPTVCRLCGQSSPQHRTLGRVDGTVRASAQRCTLCGAVQAFWRADPAASEERGKLVPLCTGAHIHRIDGEEPSGYGPCEDCGIPYTPTVLVCLGCAERHEAGTGCGTPRCQAQAAAFAAELRANHPEPAAAEETP